MMNSLEPSRSDNMDDSNNKTPSTSKRAPLDISELVKQFEDLMQETRRQLAAVLAAVWDEEE